MKSKKRLIKNTMIIAVGKLSTQVITFLLLPLYTAILTSSEYGMYDFINTLALFLVPLVTLLMEEAMFRFLIDAEGEEEKRIIITQAVMFIITSLIIISISLFIILSIIGYKLKYYLILFLAVSVYNALSEALSRGVGKIKLYSLSAFISSSLIIILNVLFIAYFRIGMKGLLISYIIANIVAATFVYIRLKVWHYIVPRNLNSIKMKEMIKYSIPLVPNSVSWVIINLSDRMLITAILGAGANGIYAVANKFPSIINTLYGYFYTAWKEEASRSLKEEDPIQYYNSIYKDLKRLLFSICIFLISILPLAFNILIGKKFSEAYKYIPLLMVSMIFSNISGFYGGIFSANKNTKPMGISTIISAVLNVVFNLLLLRKMGIYSAVISTFLANALVCIYRNIKLRQYIIFEKDSVFYLTAAIILGSITLFYYSNLIQLYILGFFISFIYIVYVNKNIIVILSAKLMVKGRKIAKNV